MILFCTFGFVVLLVLLAAMNILWFFLLPEKGENHPTVKSITELKRSIERAQEDNEISWDVLKRQMKNLKVQISMIPSNKSISAADLTTTSLLLESFYLFVEGTWRQIVMEDDLQSIYALYEDSYNKLSKVSARNLELDITVDANNGLKRKIDLSDSVKSLSQLVALRFQAMEQYNAA